MSEIILSIGMIVKDEIRCIEKCLKALEPLRKAVPSQLVIADTGSTDGTREIAARYADVFFDIPWENDFSAARNAVLARCSGRWYFSIDADEYLDERIDNLVQFLTTPSELENKADYGLITIFNYADQSLDKETATAFFAARIARIHPGLKYVGKIHERFVGVESPNYVNIPDGFLWHDGYAYETSEQIRRKAERNMQLLEEELEQNPDDPLRIVQCIESSRNIGEKLKYIEKGLALIQQNATGWNQQGASLLRHAVKWATSVGSPKLQEWLQLAHTLYPDSPLTQIDINGTMAMFYYKCMQWDEVLKAADGYWEGIQKLDRNEYPPEIFATILLSLETQSARECVALLQAEACYHLERPKLAIKVLRKVPLRTIGTSHVAGLVGLLAKLSQKLDVTELFCIDARNILAAEPSTREDWRRRDALRKALKNLFNPSNSYSLPAKLLIKLKDDVYAPAAAIMDAEDIKELQGIADSVHNWRYIPSPAIYKLVEKEIAFPDTVFQTMQFEDICRIANYLVRQENETARLLRFVNSLDTSDKRMTVWSFEIISKYCAKFKWKNVKLSSQVYKLFCASAERFLAIVYPADILYSEYADAVLPQNCRFACKCLTIERHFENADYHTCVRLLKELLKAEPSMREMILFLTNRVEETVEQEYLKKRITPEMVAMAKQIRAVLEKYPADDPTVFVLKSSEQYQKMKFLIEDPNLDNL